MQKSTKKPDEGKYTDETIVLAFPLSLKHMSSSFSTDNHIFGFNTDCLKSKKRNKVAYLLFLLLHSSYFYNRMPSYCSTLSYNLADWVCGSLASKLKLQTLQAAVSTEAVRTGSHRHLLIYTE